MIRFDVLGRTEFLEGLLKRVEDALQTWFGYQAGIGEDCSRSLASRMIVVAGGLRGCGRFKMFRTVDAAMKMFSKANWLAIRTRPQSTFTFVISQTRAAISRGVLLAGAGEELLTSILWSYGRESIEQSRVLGDSTSWNLERFHGCEDEELVGIEPGERS